MVVSHKHKYLFVEVPSTGSTAISAELTSHYDGEAILRKHANFTEFRKLVGVQAKDYFVFATVRNPLDLAVTEFLKLKGNHKSQYTTPKFFERNGGFVPDQQLREFEFIRKHDADFSRFFLEFRKIIYHNWFLICHSNFGYIMRYERLEEEFAHVLKEIGLKSARPLPRVNPTALKTRRFENFYSPETVEDAYKYYGPFMRQWGYQFPSEWVARDVPWSSTLKYRMKESAVNFAGRFVTLSPFSPVVQKVKSIADAVL